MFSARKVSLALSGLAALTLLSVRPAAAQTTLYHTDFESPTFVTGLLDGQHSFSAFDGISKNAATVSTAFPKSGSQSVKIDGSLVELYNPSDPMNQQFYGGFFYP